MPRKASAQQLQLESPSLGVRTPRDARRRSRTRSREGERVSASVEAPPTQNDTARKPSPAQLLLTPGALLTRSHLRQLGLERRAIDAVFRALPVVALPGYSRPMIRAEQYLELVEHHTYRDDRVRPCHA
jgi:hypothetical protein